MSEFVRTTMELAPIAGAVTGAAIGAVAENIIQGKIIKERVAAHEAMDSVNDEIITQDSKFKNRVKKFVGPLALAGAFIGGVNGEAWSPEDQVPAPHASVQVVVDRSGATAISKKGPTAAENIDRVVARIDSVDNFSLTAHVAESGGSKTTNIEEVKSIQPFGDAPMREAFQDATETLRLANPENNKGTENPAIIVVTNGNTIGKPAKVIEQSNETRNPVYIVNVDENINDEAEDGLQKISKRTKGEYWDISETDIKDIPNVVSKDISPLPEQPGTDSKLPLKVLGLFGIGMGLVLTRFRRNMPLTFNANNIAKGEK